MPGGGIEPPQGFWPLRILSPLRLPISPSRLALILADLTDVFYQPRIEVRIAFWLYFQHWNRAGFPSILFRLPASKKRNKEANHDGGFPQKFCAQFFLLNLLAILVFAGILHAGNDVLGEIELVGATKVERTSGVWIDRQYIGYLNELKGSKKLLLLPGEHEIMVRQGGYIDFVQKITIRAGEKQVINVKMDKDTRVQMPRVTAEIKLDVNPNRAAVFVDGVFVGHVAEFGGIARALLVEPGKRKVTISLPGYQTFETDIDLVVNQKSVIKTALMKGGAAEGISPQ